jgi:predicted RecB family nuclease
MANAAVKTKQANERRLCDLAGVGKAMLEDFDQLGITTVKQLARSNPKRMFERLCEIKRSAIDICCYDVFVCAVAQARDPQLPAEQRNWWYWSRVRKASEK